MNVSLKHLILCLCANDQEDTLVTSCSGFFDIHELLNFLKQNPPTLNTAQGLVANIFEWSLCWLDTAGPTDSDSPHLEAFKDVIDETVGSAMNKKKTASTLSSLLIFVFLISFCFYYFSFFLFVVAITKFLQSCRQSIPLRSRSIFTFRWKNSKIRLTNHTILS